LWSKVAGGAVPPATPFASIVEATTDMTDQSHSTGPTHRAVEIGVTVCTAAFGVIVIIGSLQAGIGWGVEGPRAGFFPFYLGLTILGASIVNFAQVVSSGPGEHLFAEWRQLWKVLSVVIPTATYVVVIPYIGIYAASVLLIAFFMKWLGRYHWAFVGAIAIGVPVLTFAIFEKWFLLPLPKGPIEEFLGF
jgi:hypothetical protein